MATLCLNMIVKNESKVIINTLENLTSKIRFDYYCICDTDSTDNTCELINTFFKNKNIPGEIHNHQWKNFGYNRTLALECAFKKTDYLLVFDADDTLEGDFNLPELTMDSYMLKFGSESSSYERLCLVKNNLIWKYHGVLHEYIKCDSPTSQGSVPGNYYIFSGRTSSRNSDPNKYLNDATILNEAYHQAIKDNDPLSNRYAYYCANSYADSGNKELAIEWYLITLKSFGWFDERYNSCLKLYEYTNDLSYLVLSFHHNPRRVEGIYELVKHYCCTGNYSIAWGYYQFIKGYYEAGDDDLSTKLFARVMDYTFFLPYYMIIVCEKMKEYQTGLKMYNIIFEKKCNPGQWWINNLIHNYQFYLPHNNNISFDNYLPVTPVTPVIPVLLIYTGFSDIPWNMEFFKNHALGGSEKAVIYLAKEFSKSMNVIISGDVLPETVGNIKFIHRFNLQSLIDTTTFECIIVSRYVSFFTIYPKYKSKKVILMAHDVHFMNNLQGCNKEVYDIIKSNPVNECVCLNKWHAGVYTKLYPCLTIKVINNGIPFVNTVNTKVPNSFIFTSCSVRGLDKLIGLWSEILKYIPDATLNLSSYQDFPKNEFDNIIFEKIKKFSSIKHHGKLNENGLYKMMSKSEYWFYPCNFDETSCITAMEMLMHSVICIYYPRAGLTDTLGNCGIQVKPGNEIDTIMGLRYYQKECIKKKGKEYSESCSWKSRSIEWISLIKSKKLIFYLPKYFNENLLNDYFESLKIEYHVTVTKNLPTNADAEIIFVHEVFDLTVFTLGCDVSYLNTEPLNIPDRLNLVKSTLKRYPQLKNIYDYSLSNIHILNSNKSQLLEYPHNPVEINFLKEVSKEIKEYDYGIIRGGSDTHGLTPPRRMVVVDYLRSKGFTVNIISGWGKDRDRELGKCKCILNIHGLHLETVSGLFEHIRCNRLLYAGYSILSETSLNLSLDFINKHKSLKIIDYHNFLKIKKCYCFIHSCNLDNGLRLNHLLKGLPNTFEKVFINNIGPPLKMKSSGVFEVTEFSENVSLFEIPTIDKMWEFAKLNKDCNILYLHTKGNSHHFSQPINDWIDLMLYFLFQYPTDIGLVDTIGCNYHIEPVPHFSGNFWWVNSNYLATLPECGRNKMDAEFWLHINNPTFKCLHESGVDHYHSVYPPEKYLNI